MARKLNQKKGRRSTRKPARKPSARQRRAPRSSSDRIVKAWRPTLNFPRDLEARIKTRVEEIPYRSFPDYVLALVLFDIWSRRPHRYTKELMALPYAARDKAIANICEAFDKGEQRSADPAFYDHVFKRLVDAEVRKLGFTPT